MYEYATLHLAGGIVNWELHHYDWNKAESRLSGDWKNAIEALNELSQQGWEVIGVYPTPQRNEDEKDGLLCPEEYLLKRRRQGQEVAPNPEAA